MICPLLANPSGQKAWRKWREWNSTVALTKYPGQERDCRQLPKRVACNKANCDGHQKYVDA